MPEELGAEGVSPTPDAVPAPSAEAPPQGPGPTPPPETKPWNQPPEERWQEVLRQRDEARAQATAALQLAQQAQANQTAAQPVRTVADPLEGLTNHPDPATAQFWQQVQRVSEVIADRKTQEHMTPLQQTLDLGRQQLAQVTVSQFRRDNPDIVPGSAEEQAISVRIQQGYPLEEAKRIVMYDVLQKRLSQQSSTQTQRQAEQRRQASPEATSGIPATAGGSQPRKSFRETQEAELKAAGF